MTIVCAFRKGSNQRGLIDIEGISCLYPYAYNLSRPAFGYFVSIWILPSKQTVTKMFRSIKMFHVVFGHQFLLKPLLVNTKVLSYNLYAISCCLGLNFTAYIIELPKYFQALLAGLFCFDVSRLENFYSVTNY